MQTKEETYEMILSSFIDGTKTLVPAWFQDRRGNSVPTPPFHYEIEDLIMAEKPDGTRKHKYLAVRAPRGHAKSTIISKSYPLWRALMSACVEDIDEYLVIVSASFRQSHSWLRSIVDSLRFSKEVNYYFGKVQKGAFWRYGDGDVVLKFPTGREVRLRAAGAGMEIRGDQSGNVRPTGITLDDITDDVESKTANGRASRVDWVLSSVVPALDPEGWINNVGTPRPYEDDWNAGIIEELSDEKHGDEKWVLRTYRSIPDLNNDEIPTLWPERHTRKSLMSKLESWKSIGREHLWWSEYQCEIVSQGDKAFHREWYEPFRWDGTLVNHPAGPYLETKDRGRIAVNTFVGVDPAFSKARTADHTVISCWGMTNDRHWYQIEQIRRQGMNTKDAVNEAVMMGARNQAKHIMFEKVAAQAALTEWAIEVQEQLRQTGDLKHYMQIRDVTPTTQMNKESRIKGGLQTPYALGRVHHKMGMHREIERELDNFPAVHPDCLDSAYYAFIESYPAVHALPTVETAARDVKKSYDWLTGEEIGDRPRYR